MWCITKEKNRKQYRKHFSWLFNLCINLYSHTHSWEYQKSETVSTISIPSQSQICSKYSFSHKIITNMRNQSMKKLFYRFLWNIGTIFISNELRFYTIRSQQGKKVKWNYPRNKKKKSEKSNFQEIKLLVFKIFFHQSINQSICMYLDIEKFYNILNMNRSSTVTVIIIIEKKGLKFSLFK